MPTLYEIGEDLDALDALLAEVGGDVSEEEAEAAIDAWLQETAQARDEKLDRYAALIREKEARAAARQQEADRMATLAATDTNAARKLKTRLCDFLLSQGIKKVDTPRFRISVSGNGGKQGVSVNVPVEDLPADLRETRTTVLPLTDLIRERLEAGEALLDGEGRPLASLNPRGHHVRIR